MDNRNSYLNQQSSNTYYPYGYPAANPALMRPEMSTYLIPQAASAAVLKGRPVSSFEEARVAQIDLDGSLTFFPDFGNKKIYTKKINPDGTASLNTYILDENIPVEAASIEYATKDDISQLKQTLEDIMKKIQKETTKPLNF